MSDFENTKCDFCKEPATKDAKLSGLNSWVYVCDDCFFKYCSCNEGTFTTLKNIGKQGRKPYSD